MKVLRNYFILLFLSFSFFIEAKTNQLSEKKEFHFLDIVAKKRDGKDLSKDEINYFVQEYTKKNIPDYQASSFLMAIYINGMNINETAHLTDAMLHSGTVVSFEDIQEPIVDKHSTGGVGDKTSLILAPICAALDVKVPMISGRGLGHTGGTLDKLESIPGFIVKQDIKTYKKLVKEQGLCIIGQTKDIVPADKKMYALRDTCACTESKPLIASSILSKKMAEGLDALIMDVKTGSGALIKEFDDSVELAQIMINIGRKLGKKVVALITDMNQPLGMYVGNSLELIESIQILKGNCLPNQEDIRDLSIALASHMLIAAKKAKDEQEAQEKIMQVISDGSALKKFKEMVVAQGGNPNAIEDFSLLPTAEFKYSLKAQKSGFVKSLDAMKIAKGCSILGSGRITKNTKIDLSVGTIIYKKIGNFIEIGDTILEIHYNDEKKLQEALSYFEDAYELDNQIHSRPALIKKILK